jgi:ABC-2 type transport system permease protein
MRNRVMAEMRAARAFVDRNLNLSKRYWKWELVFLVYTIANSVTIGFIGRGVESITGTSINTEYYVLYMLLGSILWGYLSILFEIISETVSWERWEETIEYTFMAPVHRATHLLSVCGYAIIYGIIRSSIILLVLSFFFKLDMGTANFSSALYVLAIASLSFIGLGMCAAILPLVSPEKGMQVVSIFQSLLLMFSGVYYEINILPQWMQWVARFSPATYALRGMRASILNGAGWSEVWIFVGPLLIFGAIMIPSGILLFIRMERWAKQKGVLKRSG